MVDHFRVAGDFGIATEGALVFAQIVGRVRALHHSQPIDLIHAHEALPCGHAAMLLSQELGIPFVVSVHGLDYFSVLQKEGELYVPGDRISRRTYASAQRVICESEQLRELLLRKMGRTCRTSVVYNGVDPQLFLPVESSLSESLVVLTAGSLLSVQGYECLLHAAFSLASEFPGLCWEIIGDQPNGSRFKNLARQLAVQTNVRFLGDLARHDDSTAMKSCTLFALPIRDFGLGNVYFEAMSSGKVVIGCRGNAITEIIHHGFNGFLVGPENDKELALAVAMLLRDKSRRDILGRAARDTILDGLTLLNQAEHLGRIYRESIT
ncbi:MAG TPA: glycosyltransferase [Candidatus Sulfotelmatobacter sp.]